MNRPQPQASLADLARSVRVEEGEQQDKLELASAWARLPEHAPDRTVALIGAGLAGLVLALLLLQAAIARTVPTLLLALLAMAAATWVCWHFRAWFWRTAVDVNAEHIRLAMLGWGVPAPVQLPIAQIQTLSYRMDGGRLALLTLEHSGGSLPLPFSGQRELDKLYCNILLHLLQKRRPDIAFEAASETT